MVLASAEEHQGGSCTAHSGEWIRPPVDTALRWGREEAEVKGRLAEVWGMRGGEGMATGARDQRNWGRLEAAAMAAVVVRERLRGGVSGLGRLEVYERAQGHYL